VTCWDKDGWTPLHHACRNDHADVAAHLIAEGADVNAKNKVRSSFVACLCYGCYASQ
jgi:ankyrin repeat protein